MTVIEKLEQTLLPLIEQGKRIAITGHSSGGAIDCAFADDFEQNIHARSSESSLFVNLRSGIGAFRNTMD